MSVDQAADCRADAEHEARTLAAVRAALASVPFYAKQDLASRVVEDGPLHDVLARLPLLTRERVRPTLPKAWFPAGRDPKAELASGAVAVIEAGTADSRVRVLFDASDGRGLLRRRVASRREGSDFAPAQPLIR